MKDRMLSDEVLLALIKKNGGGGTSDYSRLTNKPEINGVTLNGDKSASDLSLASLDANGKVPAAQLPSYVDDVINGYLYEGHFYEDSAHTTEITGESGKIYVDLESNKTYRWSGLAFVEVSESLALGETASTAYAGDKGKANADAITAIKDGQTIDSFGDVESALANKVDKVDGKGLSTNDYTDADKAIVGGVTAALAGKQDDLTAGDYISIDANDEITVNREIPSVSASYELKTTSTSDPDINTDVIKRVNGEIVWTQNYNYQTVRDNPVTIDDVFVLSYSGQWKYKLLVASDDHAAGYEQTWGWSAWVDYTENFSLVDNTGKKLIIKSELDTALTSKQNATDNNLETTSKTVVGAINEHEGDIDSLKSGLTNVQGDVKLNTQDLTTGSRTKNLAPFTLENLKKWNTAGTWDGNTYTNAGITWTVGFDSNGNIDTITANGTATETTNFETRLPIKVGTYILSGAPADTPESSYYMQMYHYPDTDKKDRGSGVTVTIANAVTVRIRAIIPDAYEVTNVVFRPMVRLASITDATFEPYIESVNTRMDNLVKTKEFTIATGTTQYDGFYFGGITHNITGTIISVYIVGTGSNHAAFLNYCNDTTIRVCSPVSETNVTVKVAYI